MKTKWVIALALAGLLVLSLTTVLAGPPAKMKMTTPIPESISTPDKVETSIGALELFDGVPTHKTVETAYDFLDKAFFVCLRMYGPTEPWIEGKWRPSNVDEVK